MAVAGIAAIAVAVFAFLWLWANLPILNRIAQSLAGPIENFVPWIGHALAQAILTAGASGLDWAEQALGPLTSSLWKISGEVRGWYNQETAAMIALGAALTRQATLALPALESRARQYTDQAGSYVTHYAEQLYNQAVSYANQTLAWARQYTDQAGAYVTHYAEQLYNQAVGIAEQNLARALAYADKIGIDAAGQILSARRELALALDAGLGRVIDHADKIGIDANARIDQAWRDLGQAIDRVHIRATDYTDATVGAAAGAAALSLGRVVTRVQDIERSRCMQHCDTLGSLGETLNAIDLGALLLLVVAAAENAPAAAKVVEEDVAPFVRETAETFRSLVGV